MHFSVKQAWVIVFLVLSFSISFAQVGSPKLLENTRDPVWGDTGIAVQTKTNIVEVVRHWNLMELKKKGTLLPQYVDGSWAPLSVEDVPCSLHVKNKGRDVEISLTRESTTESRALTIGGSFNKSLVLQETLRGGLETNLATYHLLQQIDGKSLVLRAMNPKLEVARLEDRIIVTLFAEYDAISCSLSK